MDDSGRENRKYGEHKQIVKDNEINLLDYLRVIFKYRRVVLLIYVAAVTVIVSLLLPKIYSATASIVPPMEILQTESNLAGGLGVGKGSMLGQIIDVTSIADMYVDILESRAVVDAIIDRFDLMKIYGEEQYRSNARRMLGQSTDVKVSSDGIVRISVTDIDPNRAAAIANAYVEELDQQNKASQAILTTFNSRQTCLVLRSASQSNIG